MTVPLFLLAALWDRFDLGRRSWLRGREFSIGHLRLHTTSLVSGIMFILLGTAFIAYEGTSALSGLYEEKGAADLAYAAEQWVSSFTRSVPDALVLAVAFAAALAALAVVAYGRRRRKLHGLKAANEGVGEFAGEKRADGANR
jgi:divalent metal cation (Fe/Co/Zn/Cd) transporter